MSIGNHTKSQLYFDKKIQVIKVILSQHN